MDTPICHIDLLNVTSNLDVSVNTDIHLDFLEEQQQKDPVYQEIFEAVRAGTAIKSLDKSHPILELRLELSELHTIKDRKLLTYQGKIYIPAPAISNVLLVLHEGHAGYIRCLNAAKQSVFWPSMAKYIQHQV